jgi:DNA (cytosine-5)-methyltransferase 1
MNYYNEFDTKTAAWLRELISAKLIPAGDVDTRSIVDVSADELRGYTQCHFFAGIGGWSLALQLAGWPADKRVWSGSTPCQPFSTAGKGLAQADERHLWPVFFNLIKECRPEYVFGEQVASAIGKGWLDGISTDLGEEGYTCGSAVLGAHSVGSPHIRQRLYWVAYSDGGQCKELRPSRDIPSKRPIQPAPCDSASDRMADPEGEGRLRNWGIVERGDDEFQWHQERKRQLCESEPQGLCATHWSNCTIIPCRDGKARRIPAQAIIEPVFQHVLDGFSCSLDARRNILSAAQGFPLTETIPARVILLKGAGNAIVPAVAAEFIQAFQETQAATA